MNDDVAFARKDDDVQLFENRIPSEWLSTEEAAEYLRISGNALRCCVYRGQITAFRFGRRLRFRVEDVRRLLQKGGV